MEPDWSSLPADLLILIAGFFTLLEDFIVFRGVCTSWRSAAFNVNFVSKVPLLMLSEKEDTDEREFFSLSKRKICMKMSFPDAKGNRCMDVGFGWILTLAESGDVCMWKPISSARIQLPNFKTFPAYKIIRSCPEVCFIHRAWLTANPSETSNFALLMLLNQNYLGFWRDGDKCLGMIKRRIKSPVMTFLKGDKFILLDLDGNLLIWDLQETDISRPKALVLNVDDGPDTFATGWKDYLVESTAGELLVIRRRYEISAKFYEKMQLAVNHFEVKQLERSTLKFTSADNLGKDAIFIGDNVATSVDATQFPGVLKPNSIYFTDDNFNKYSLKKYCPNGGGKDMGIYDFENHSVERFEVESLGLLCSPLWVFPSF